MTETPDLPIPEEAETRVVLVKPDDVLLIGNLGEIRDPQGAANVVRTLQDVVGVRVLLFEADIDIAKLPKGELG